jgi:hypothetical protein
MTLVIAFIVSHLAWIGGALALAVTFFAGHKVASSAADGKVKAAQDTAVKAQGEAAVAKATIVAVSAADDAKTAAQSIPDASLDQAGRDRGILRD